MEESFLLSYYGKVSLIEQETMTAEERAWWIKRIDTEVKRSSGKQDTSSTGPPTPKK